MDFHNTLSIEHNRRIKKFQWRKSYSLKDFKALLGQVFGVPANEILGLKDRSGNVFDLDYFCKNPHELKVQVYYLLLESSAPPGPASSGKKPRLFEKTGEVDRNDFLYFLDRMLEEQAIAEEDYYFVKCMFFEQNSFVLNFTRSALSEKNPFKFQSLIHDLLATRQRTGLSKSSLTFRSPQSYRVDYNLLSSSPHPNLFDQTRTEPTLEKTPVLRPKTPYPELSREIMQFIEERLCERLEITARELETLRSLIVGEKNETILSSFEVFQSNKDEEDFLDTIKRVLVKIRGPAQAQVQVQASVRKGGEPSSGGKASYFVSQRTEEKRPEVPREDQRVVGRAVKVVAEETKTQQPAKPREEVPRPRVEVAKPREDVAKPREEVPKKAGQEAIKPRPQETHQKVSANPKKNMLDLIFKTFFEETEEEFEPIEVGFAKHLYEKSDAELINVLNTCDTIPKAVVLIKGLAIKAYTDWLEKNFEPKQREYILKNRTERSSENFKSEGKVDHLNKVLHAVVLSKSSLNVNLSVSSAPAGNSKGQKTTKFSDVAVSRSKNKKTSFRMMLQRESQCVSVKTEENDVPVIVTMVQEENPELREILNNFYEEESYKKGGKNAGLLEEIIKDADFLGKESQALLRRMLEEQNYDLLMILSKFERLNKNVKKVKADLTNMLNKNDAGELTGSPIIKKKHMKYNAFKHTLSDIFEKYRLISQKQVKLFQYLYLEEDLTVLGAYEVFLKTNELQDFIENLVIIDKYHYFKTRLDFDEIEQFDKSVEAQLEVLFMYKKYLTNDQRTNLEKIIRAGDSQLLAMYTEFRRNNRSHEDFLKHLIQLADQKSKELQDMMQKIMENSKFDTVEKKRLETIDTFFQSKFLKKVTHMDLITELVEGNHKLINALFSIYENNKDKADFIENLTLVHNWAYKENYRKIVMKLKDTMNLKKNQVNFLLDCIEFDLPNIMAPYEIYMVSAEDENRESELRESIRIILNVYVKEIYLLEKKYY